MKTWGGFGPGTHQYQDPVGIAVGPDGRLHVLDDVRGVVETYDPDEVHTLSDDGSIGYTADCPQGHRYSGRLGG